MAALHLAIMPWGVRANKLVADAQHLCRLFKERGQTLLRGEAISEFGAVISLYALHCQAFASEPRDSSSQEIGGRIGTLLLVSAQEAQPGEIRR